MDEYPKVMYSLGKDPVTVYDADSEAGLGEGWHTNPGAFGVEHAPGATPDPAIAANKPAEEAVPVTLMERVAKLEAQVQHLMIEAQIQQVKGGADGA
jgi:hypothetical protein